MVDLYYNINERCELTARYIVDKNCTVREAAKHFDVSKSTVHKDVTERLEYIDHALYIKARAVLERNKKERHIRGGLSTKNKYIKEKTAEGQKNG